MTTAPFNILLASASPRRKALLEQLGLNPMIHPAHVDETPLQNEHAVDYTLRVATSKATAIAQQFQHNTPCPILAADTCVHIDNHTIFGKPEHFEDAKRIWVQLGGKTHTVTTVVILYNMGKLHHILTHTHVEFATLSESEMLEYWQTGEPTDKAGAYAIQGIGGQFVKSVQGSVSGVIGLPLHETKALLHSVLHASVTP